MLRDVLSGFTPENMHAAWPKFVEKVYLPAIGEMTQAHLDGVKACADAATGRPTSPEVVAAVTPPQVPPQVPPVAEDVLATVPPEIGDVGAMLGMSTQMRPGGPTIGEVRGMQGYPKTELGKFTQQTVSNAMDRVHMIQALPNNLRSEWANLQSAVDKALHPLGEYENRTGRSWQDVVFRPANETEKQWADAYHVARKAKEDWAVHLVVPTTQPAPARKTPITIEAKTPGAKTTFGVGGMAEASNIEAGDARATGYAYGADFPGAASSPTRGELFFVTAGKKIRQGIGSSLSQDALRLMRANGAETVNMSTTSEGGRALVASLIRDGYISEPIRTSETGKSEHRILIGAQPTEETAPGKAVESGVFFPGRVAQGIATAMYRKHQRLGWRLCGGLIEFSLFAEGVKR